MENNILLTLSGEQFVGAKTRETKENGNHLEEQDITEVVTPASLYEKNGNTYIFYEEVLEGTDESLKNSIKIMPDRIEVSKKGSTSVRMIFQKGAKEETNYYTPFGAIQLRIATTNIEKIKSEGMEKLNISYNLEVNYEHLAKCEMTISWEYLQTQNEYLDC